MYNSLPRGAHTAGLLCVRMLIRSVYVRAIKRIGIVAIKRSAIVA
jgi:hypothetical protein